MGVYRNYRDEELTPLLVEGDRVAYTELYNRYKKRVYVHAYRILQDREEAKDVVQELFTVLWTRRETLNYSNGFAGYVYSAARNKVLDRIARKKVDRKSTRLNSSH